MRPGARVLVCDDEELIRWSLKEHLSRAGYEVVDAVDGVDALEQARAQPPDLVLTDLKMPRMGGLDLIRRLRAEGLEVPVVVLTAHGGVDSAIEATRLGARDYLSKPFDLREVELVVERALEAHRMEQEVRYLRRRRPRGYGDIIGESPAMQRMFETLRRLEDVDAPTILLVGPSGTGKDLIAHAIHESGPRRRGPMMEIDCASLPDQLIESELFGHEAGAFTDARQAKPGLFEVARSGSIFLDEIGEISPGTQAKLLRALENRRFRRVGGVRDIALEAGIIAATNRDLAAEVKAGRFREDLYFRLNVIRVDVPPLRERREDIPLLVEHFLERFNRSFNRNVQGIAQDALDRMMRYPWPGNVRELRNVIERIVILEPVDVIRLEHLPAEIRYGTPQRGADVPFVLPEEGIRLEDLERSLLVQAMERTGGNQSAAARLLGISRYALRYRLEKYGLSARD